MEELNNLDENKAADSRNEPLQQETSAQGEASAQQAPAQEQPIGEEAAVQSAEAVSPIKGEWQIVPTQSTDIVPKEQALQQVGPTDVVPQEWPAPPKKPTTKKRIEKETLRNMYIMGNAIIALAVYCIALGCFLFGAVTYNSSSLHVISAITLIINITNIASLYWYSIAAGVAISVGYIITFIIAIKKLVAIIKYAPKALSAAGGEKVRMEALIITRRTAFEFFLSVLTLQGIANIFSNNALNGGFIALLVLCGIFYVGMDVLDYFINEKEFELFRFIIFAVRSAALASAMLIAFCIVNKDMLDGFFFGAKLLFSGSLFKSTNANYGIYNFYYYILSYVMFVALDIIIILQCHKVFKRHAYYDSKYSVALSQDSIGQIIYVGIAALFDLILMIVGGYGFVMSEHLTIYLRVACLLVTCIITYLPLENELSKLDVRPQERQQQQKTA